MRGALRNQDERVQKNKRRHQLTLFDVNRIKYQLLWILKYYVLQFRQIGGEVTYDGDFVLFEGSHYRRGFLYKPFPMNAIIADGVKPTISELERFQDTSEDLKKECTFLWFPFIFDNLF